MSERSRQARADRRLVRRMLRGDEAAFDEFADAYIPVIYRFAGRRLFPHRELLNDVVQSTICKVLSKLHTYRGEAALATWLCACCRNEIASELRRRGSRPHEVELLDQHSATNSVTRPCPPSPELSVLGRERAGLVHEALDRIPPRYANALEWKYIEETSVQEIARRLGLTPKAAESLLSRARRSLRIELEQSRPDLLDYATR